MPSVHFLTQRETQVSKLHRYVGKIWKMWIKLARNKDFYHSSAVSDIFKNFANIFLQFKNFFASKSQQIDIVSVRFLLLSWWYPAGIIIIDFC